MSRIYTHTHTHVSNIFHEKLSFEKQKKKLSRVAEIKATLLNTRWQYSKYYSFPPAMKVVENFRVLLKIMFWNGIQKKKKKIDEAAI